MQFPAPSQQRRISCKGRIIWISIPSSIFCCSKQDCHRYTRCDNPNVQFLAVPLCCDFADVENKEKHDLTHLHPENNCKFVINLPHSHMSASSPTVVLVLWQFCTIFTFPFHISLPRGEVANINKTSSLLRLLPRVKVFLCVRRSQESSHTFLFFVNSCG